jgi:hypothetical protein
MIFMLVAICVRFIDGARINFTGGVHKNLVIKHLQYLKYIKDQLVVTNDRQTFIKKHEKDYIDVFSYSSIVSQLILK